MKVKVLNVFNNNVIPKSSLKGKHGNAFYLEFENEKILFDTGSNGPIFLHNLRELQISPDSIDKIIFSHGHDDHTLGLEDFIRARSIEEKISVIGHPLIKEKKYLKILGLRISYIGYPKLEPDVENKINYILTKEQFQINEFLYTTGEIQDRPFKDGTAKYMVHNENGKWVKDPLLDDLSLVLKTENGLVLICGCCHSGLLNTCAHAVERFNASISAIIGGTHMMFSSRKELSKVATILEEKYNTPQLYLNHCTGKKKIKFFEKYFSSDIVKPCLVGTELTFNI